MSDTQNQERELMKKAGLKLHKHSIDDYDFTSKDGKQLSLFNLLEEKDKQYSNIFDLYDAAPKVVWRVTKKLKKENGDHKPMERQFNFRGVDYQVTVTPAQIKTKKLDSDGGPIWKVILPRRREELVEESIRKIAADGQGRFIEGYFSVYFSMRQVQRVLKTMKQTLNLGEIRESIEILSKSNIEIQTVDKTEKVNSPFFMAVGLVSRDEWVKEKDDAVCAVSFNTLIDKAVRSGEYRRYNYIKAAQYDSLASWIYKRLCRNFKQADSMQLYGIWLSTIVHDSPMSKDQRLRKSREELKKALDKLKDGDDIASWEEVEIKYDKNRKDKILDVKFLIRASSALIRDIIVANKKQSVAKKEIQRDELPGKFKVLREKLER